MFAAQNFDNMPRVRKKTYKEEKVQVQARISESLRETLKKIAEREDLPLTVITKRMILAGTKVDEFKQQGIDVFERV